MKAVDAYLDANARRFESELIDLLRIPSVSTDPEHAGDVRRAADFVAKDLGNIGLEAEVIPTAGHPVVYAEWLGAAGAPTVLVYGHYDVQPPDPLELWITPPFEPTVRDGNLYARGATDDKGQMMTHVKSVEAWMKTEGRLPVNVKFLIEGEEEIGSEHLAPFVRAEAARLAADCCVISDTCQFAAGVPAITYGLKGIVYYEVRLRGPARDLHSGSFGGSVANPANALARMLGALVDGGGRVQVPGFYDDVAPLADWERRQFAELPFDEAAYKRQHGVEALFGEEGYTTLERRWARPTCDVNGLFGGFRGEGSKTIVPAEAGAKVSFRLVPHQDPKKITAAFRGFLAGLCLPGIQMEVREFHNSPAVLTPVESPAVQAAGRAIEQGFGARPVFIREGGSSPVVTTFHEALGLDTLLLGWGLPDDNTHSPNEKFCLADFHRGIKASAHLWRELAIG
jgi:succinyl-diaminopimelate desuccinylase